MPACFAILGASRSLALQGATPNCTRFVAPRLPWGRYKADEIIKAIVKRSPISFGVSIGKYPLPFSSLGGERETHELRLSFQPREMTANWSVIKVRQEYDGLVELAGREPRSRQLSLREAANRSYPTRGM